MAVMVRGGEGGTSHVWIARVDHMYAHEDSKSECSFMEILGTTAPGATGPGQ